MDDFIDDKVNLSALKKKAYNYRWAEVDDDVIPLTAADSDFPVSNHIKDALVDYIQDGYFSYAPKRGLEDFNEAVYNYVKKIKKEKVDRNCILPTDSAARGMYIIAESILCENDEAIIFNPVDFLFRDSVMHVGAKIIEYPVKWENNFIDLSDLESFITPKTKMIGLCNPHNPLGLIYSKENLELLMYLVDKYDLYIMNDEIWSDIVYPNKSFLSILNLENIDYDRVVTVYGFSKSFGIAGLRIGCIYTTNKVLFDRIIDVSCIESTAGGVSSLSQVAAIACLNDSLEWLEEFKIHLIKMRNYAYKRLSKMPLLKCYKPEATYMFYVNIKKFGIKSQDFCNYMEKNVKLALIPGGDTFFGSESEGYIRICFATSYNILKDGLDRLEKGIEMLIEEKHIILK